MYQSQLARNTSEQVFHSQAPSRQPTNSNKALDRSYRSRFLSGGVSSIASQNQDRIVDYDTDGEPPGSTVAPPTACQKPGIPRMTCYRSFEVQSAGPSSPSPRSLNVAANCGLKPTIAVTQAMIAAGATLDHKSLTAAMDGLRVMDSEGTACSLTASTPPHPICNRPRLSTRTSSISVSNVCQQCESRLPNSADFFRNVL